MGKDIRVTLDQDGLLLSRKIPSDTIQVDTNGVQQNTIVVNNSYSSNNIKVAKDQGNPISTRVGSKNTLKVVSGVSVGNTITSIFDLDGLDIDGSTDGNILIYDSEINLWKSSDEIDGGEY